MQRNLHWTLGVRYTAIFASVLMLMLAIPSVSEAGGWAVVTLDAAPVDVRPNHPFTIGFVVRQHGIRPVDGLTPIVTAVSSTGKKVEVQARHAGGEGHYAATLSLPAGTWTWQIDAFYPIARMGTLEVRSATPQASGIRLPRVSTTWWLWLTGIALLIVGGMNSVRRRGAIA